MTLEFSLRRRAMKARLLGIFWLFLTTVILVGTYLSLPVFANKLLTTANQIDNSVPKDNLTMQKGTQEASKPVGNAPILILGTLILGVAAVGFSCYLLSRYALIEIESSQRFSGLADALCVSGGDIGKFQTAAALLVPKGGYLVDSRMFSADDLKLLAETIKQLR